MTLEASSARAEVMSISGADSYQPPPGMGLVSGSNDGSVKPLVEDNGLVHFLRYLLIWAVVAISMYVLVGFVLIALMLSWTGRRKRDVLMMLIPIWGGIVGVQTLWRYTAKNVYWSARKDRPSKSMFAQ